MVWLVAASSDSLAGVLAISDSSHVKYFFVHPDFQKLGIGRQLWEFALFNRLLSTKVTVRSSLFAVPVYERLGFKAIEPQKTFNGMNYQTMLASFG
jgi:GNAT superfamily N-acetyltransferase